MIRGKLRDFNTLLQNEELVSHVPETRILSREWLSHLIDKHPILYVKPDASSQGLGIIRIDRMGEKSCLIRSIDGNHYSFHQNMSTLYRTITKLKRKQEYIIQQGISSETDLQFPFDIRIHVVKVNGVWTYGGMIGKVAKKKSIVTNASQGAVPTHIDTILQDFKGMTETKSTELKKSIEKVAVQVASVMGDKHPGWNEFGLDVGVDENNKIWIYEVNFKPGFILFRYIDQPAYLKIKKLREKAG